MHSCTWESHCKPFFVQYRKHLEVVVNWFLENIASSKSKRLTIIETFLIVDPIPNLYFTVNFFKGVHTPLVLTWFFYIERESSLYYICRYIPRYYMKGEIIYLLHSIVHTILHMAAPLCIYELLGREKVKKATTQHSKC